MDKLTKPLDAAQRQETRRAKMAELGKKQLGLGFVSESYHEAIKQMISELERGDLQMTEEGQIVRPFEDKRELNRLGKELDESKRVVTRWSDEYKKLKALYENERKRAEKAVQSALTLTAEKEKILTKLESLKNIFWRFYWRE
jgi:molecular chaperone GrpE (heat shock protein)